MRDGRIYGVPVSRNPLKWIPYIISLAVVLPLAFTLLLVYCALLPFGLVLLSISHQREKRYWGSLSEAGLILGSAYGKKVVLWAEVRGVVLCREPTAFWYKITAQLETDPEGQFDFFTFEYEQFEAELANRAIPLLFQHWTRGITNVRPDDC